MGDPRKRRIRGKLAGRLSGRRYGERRQVVLLDGGEDPGPVAHRALRRMYGGGGLSVCRGAVR